MSRQVRNRVTATALGVFLLGAALVTTGTANAEQVAGGGRQVVFAGGGVLGLPCRSTPSVESMTIPADGTVRLVNRTGYASRLWLDGESMGTVPDDGSTEVVFRRGTTAVTLDPTCAITDQATPVLVTTSPRLTTRPDPTPTPEDPEPTPAQTLAAPADPETPDEPMDSSATLPGPAAPASRPPTTPARPSTVRPDATPSRNAPHSATTRASRAATRSAATAVQAMPLGGAAPRVRTRTPVRGTARAVVPAFSGMPPGEDKTILPGVPTPDLPSPPETAPALAAGAPSGIVAAEPVAAMRPLPASQPDGLLAAIATIMVAGVSIAVIRAFVSQRASRAEVA